jgi:predicted nucleic acid-binding protein
VAYLIDTSILGRLANTADISHPVATRAVVELHRRGEFLHITPQVLIEFRNVATRAVALNGLGLRVAEAEAKAGVFESTFPMLEETQDIYPAWKDLVKALSVIGKRVHDDRLVAVCHVHQVTHLLTFNVSHFIPMAGHADDVPPVVGSGGGPVEIRS